MTLAERLLSIAQDDGFERLKRLRDGFELWVRDGVVHIFVGGSLEEVLDQAEARIARRGQP